MLRNLAIDECSKKIQATEISNYCKNRIKPTMLSGVKTEALLVFARTALERYFKYIKELKYTPKVGNEEDTLYVYNTLKELKNNLQDCVVNADYLIHIVQGAKVDSNLKKLVKFEEPLMNYYDAMAHKVSSHYSKKPAYIPEFLVICVLSNWIIEEERSISSYPFLKEIDFEQLIEKFELNRDSFKKDDECIISDIFNVSSVIVEKLKNTKYKVNKVRISKTRKKK